jgi:hypothetical protein
MLTKEIFENWAAEYLTADESRRKLILSALENAFGQLPEADIEKFIPIIQTINRDLVKKIDQDIAHFEKHTL